MSPSDDQGVRRLFERLKGVVPGERAAFLDEHCPDPGVRAAVEKLLAEDMPTAAPGPVEDETVASGPSTALSADQQPGAVIDRYKLIRQIGEGGFGVVYLAEQEQPVRREVALKIIKLGMDTQQVIGRFEAERQTLALMDHPHIAKVLDAGATETGRPYFVMELVRGVPLTRFCDEQNMSVRDRLELFAQVCNAVQHAHQKGIIHRDIKPSNVLVTVVDGKPVPKVIDFGIAKATQQRLAEQTAFTAHGYFVGTPAYMSPEQADPAVEDIDTRSDIYSLGVLLYELLTGALPFDIGSLREAGWDEIRRVIREDEPSKPSTCLGSLAGELDDLARLRSIDARRLTRYVRGDLDWIIMKALEKDRARRYDTATGFGEDIHRFLNDEPVLAGPPSVTYRVQKMIRRNRGFFAAAAAITVLLIGGIAGTSLGLVRSLRAERAARTEAAKSEQVATFLGDMLESVGPSVARGRDTTLLREVLDQTAERVTVELGEQPEVEATLRSSLGVSYFELSEYDRAEEAFRRALTLYQSLHGDEHRDVATNLGSLGLVAQRRDQLDQAEESFRRALAIQRRVAGDRDSDTAMRAMDLANCLVYGGDTGTEPEQLLLDALEVLRDSLGETHENVAVALNSLGNLYHHRGDLATAEDYYRQALALHRDALGADHPFVAIDQHNLASLLQEKGDTEAAEALFEETLALSRKLYPEGDELTAAALCALADLRGADPDGGPQAVELYEEALAIRRRIYSPGHDTLSLTLLELGRLQNRVRDHEAAEKTFREMLADTRQRYGDEHFDVSVALQALGRALNMKGDLEQSLQVLEESLAMQRRLLGDSDPEVATSLFNIGATRHKLGDLSGAIAALEESLAIYRAAGEGESEQAINSMERLARSLRAAGRLQESADVLREALAVRARVGTAEARDGLGTAWEFARTLAALGETEQAEETFLRVLDRPDVLGLYATGVVRGSYADFLRDLGRFSDAEAQLRTLFDDARAGDPGGRTEQAAIGRLAEFYDAWHIAEPDRGHDAQAAEWRARLAS